MNRYRVKMTTGFKLGRLVGSLADTEADFDIIGHVTVNAHDYDGARSAAEKLMAGQLRIEDGDALTFSVDAVRRDA